MKRKKSTSALQERIGHRFADPKLLDVALTHVSAATGARKRTETYQRLEFLGDHVLGLAISDLLYRSFPKADEGELSRRLADLVRKDACAEAAAAMDLAPYLRLGSGQQQMSERARTAILADVCEAVIGSVFLDAGYEAAAKLVERYWRERMLEPHRPLRDPKTMLQEWAQGRGLPAPIYKEMERKGPDHRPEFRVAVELPGIPATEGKGRSKRDAEQAAAAAMLEREGVTQVAGA
ncbi:MAG: ribonuclease III [Bradyrhizobiaceae bacterium]|nr:ribonuclease III [Bradyrhizobiaceae bacterium]